MAFCNKKACSLVQPEDYYWLYRTFPEDIWFIFNCTSRGTDENEKFPGKVRRSWLILKPNNSLIYEERSGMSYLTQEQLLAMGFKKLGKGVRISDKASIYDCSAIEIGDNSRIDDFCVISGNISIGAYCHITPQCLIAGGKPGIKMADFVTLAYGVRVFSQSDDYSGATMTNSLIPKKFKNEYFAEVVLEKHVIIGAGATIFPGVIVKEGCSIGAMALVNKSTEPWGIYCGLPARRIKERKRDLLILEKQFLAEKMVAE